MAKFNDTFKRIVSPNLAGFYGESAIYFPPIDSPSQDGVEITNVIVGDVRVEERPRSEIGFDKYQVRHFSMIIAEEVRNYCGHDQFVLKGRIEFGDVQWTIESIIDSTEIDGMLKLATMRKMRHEIGSPKAKGMR